ncbi:MAG TPA: hypothetical protein VFT43_03015 [Candidatus Polarisedimenticolia bacterium]|nr:hypothetical protein [Candidatus Polarisedimenticolia bacterium]
MGAAPSPARDDEAVDRDALERLQDAPAAGPADGEAVDRGGVAEAEVEPPVPLRQVREGGAGVAHQAEAAGLEGDAGADGVAIGRQAGEGDRHPVVTGGGDVPEEKRRAVVLRHDDVLVAVVVKVERDGAATDVDAAERRAGGGPGDDVEAAVATVAVELRRLLEGDGVAVKADVVDDVAVGDEQVEMAVVVGIEEEGPEAESQERRAAHPRAEGAVREDAAAVVVVELVGLLRQVGHEEVEAAVVVVVGHVGPHAGLRQAVLGERHAGQLADLLEGAVAAVAPEEVRRVVVGDVEVLVAVVVVVAPDDPEPLARAVDHAGLV